MKTIPESTLTEKLNLFCKSKDGFNGYWLGPWITGNGTGNFIYFKGLKGLKCPYGR